MCALCTREYKQFRQTRAENSPAHSPTHLSDSMIGGRGGEDFPGHYYMRPICGGIDSVWMDGWMEPFTSFFSSLSGLKKTYNAVASRIGWVEQGRCCGIKIGMQSEKKKKWRGRSFVPSSSFSIHILLHPTGERACRSGAFQWRRSFVRSFFGAAAAAASDVEISRSEFK